MNVYLRKKKFWWSIILCLSLILSVCISTAVASPKEQIRVLIQADKAVELDLKMKFGLRWDFDKHGFTTEVTSQQLNALKQLKNVKISIVEQAHIMVQGKGKPPKKNNSDRIMPSDQVPWGVKALYNNLPISTTSGGLGIRVAVLDTGGNQSHPDLIQNVEQCKDFTQKKSPIINGACSDNNGHGTHVSGTILANSGADGKGIWGVAPNAKLWSYKVLGNNGFGYADDIAKAIRYAADEAGDMDVKVIISMSLGSSTKSNLIADAVDYAVGKGVLVIAAAGNDGPSANTISYPGALSNVIGVAALEEVQENETYRIADFSSRGNPGTEGDYVIVERDVDVSAPGRYIESTWNNGGYYIISGTSMATPHISGLAAKMWGTHSGYSNHDVRALIQSYANNNDIKGGISAKTGDDIASGFGFPLVEFLE